MGVARSGNTCVITASGTIDTLTVSKLENAIESVMTDAPPAVVVDLLGVDFLASVGIGVLVAAQHHPTARFAVAADGPATARPLRLIGVADVIEVCPTLDEALSAVASR
ncbi:STAS domain-containing protein [Mycolicibacterium bacteremicum]|uniref:STAS domain-containing protein n=1 Tax=Mycolicibacterium bacteremicum TaxID=564198 RepID=UPI0026ECB610|nr:STAS domain-containing protein [Mycolicibacterium bacteremicum]